MTTVLERPGWHEVVMSEPRTWLPRPSGPRADWARSSEARVTTSDPPHLTMPS